MQSILGQSRAVGTLTAALESGRLHHAWIFHGPFGVGKFTTAKEFAKYLLDPDVTRDLMGAISIDPDGRIARLVDTDTHPDLHIIRKELALDSSVADMRRQKLRNIPIDLLREHMIGGVTRDGAMHDSAAFTTPTLDHAKVFLIDEAELMDGYGQNAILKTLEEPPKRTYIILVTTNLARLLPTIRSRCQQVAFTPLDDAAMEQWLVAHGADLGLESEAEREWVTSFAAGSPGLAKIASHERLYEWRAAMAPHLREFDRGGFSVSFGPTAVELIESLAKRKVKESKNASKDVANKQAVSRMMLLLGAHAQGALKRAIAAGDDATPNLAVIDMLRDAEFAIQRNVNYKLVFEDIAAQWADCMARQAVPA